MQTRNQHPAVRGQIKAYKASWKRAHTDVTNQLWWIEDWIKVGISAHRLLEEVIRTCHDRVFRGVWLPDDRAEADLTETLRTWLNVTKSMLKRATQLEIEYGSVEGIQELRAVVDAAERQLANWRPARPSTVVGSREIVLDEAAVAELDRILAAPPAPLPAVPRLATITADELRRRRAESGL